MTFEQMQALFIFKFINYLEWPNAEGDFVIGILGDSEVKKHLNKIAETKTIGGRKIVVKQWYNTGDIGKCNMLYVSNPGNLSSVLQKVPGRAVLVLTASRGYGKKGAAINFIQEGGKTIFELNKTAIGKAGLKISNSLVALGRVVG